MAYKGQVDFIIIKLENLLTHQSYDEQQQLESILRQEDATADAATESEASGSTALWTANEPKSDQSHWQLHPQTGNSTMS
jgi:hypothetical protein